MPAGPAHGLTLLFTSPRVAPGLLSWPAWSALHEAGSILATDDPHDLDEPLALAGLAVTRTGGASVRDRARALVEASGRELVVWLGSADGDPGLTDALADELSRISMTSEPPTVEVLVGSHDLPGARLLDLVTLMDRLRSPGGCPWDAEQTHTSLAPYLLEETYEVLEAIDSGERAALQEELGDLLLQVAFHARLAEEDVGAPFAIDDVAGAIVAKLVRRHPHVFGSETAESAGHVEANWDRIKLAEKGRESALDGIPLALPALTRADKVLGRAARAGLLGPDGAASLLGTPGGDGDDPSSASRELGETLLRVVEQARAGGLDAEGALRAAVRRLEAAARGVEATPDGPARAVSEP